MEDAIVEKILLKSESLKQWAGQFPKKRYLFDKVRATGKDFYAGIRGLRGIGKTVFLLQLAREWENSVYLSCDATYLRPYPIYDLVDTLRKRGVKNIFIDEIHMRPEWGAEVKTIYDEHEVRLFFTGSSSLQLKKEGADLSRRVVLYDMKPISFREFLNIKKGFDIPAYALQNILKNGKEISIRHLSAFEHWEEYLKQGGVLYSGEGFYEALENSLEKVITNDLASLRDINLKYEQDIYKLLYHVSVSPPLEVNFSSLAAQMSSSKTFAIRLVADLSSAGVLRVVYPCKKLKKNVRKEPKIYLTIPFRMLFNPAPGRGVVREEFFVNSVDVHCYFKTERGEKTPDFMVDGITIEVGGASKNFQQAPDYVAVDSALFEDKKVPLFLFGFLY